MLVTLLTLLLWLPALWGYGLPLVFIGRIFDYRAREFKPNSTDTFWGLAVLGVIANLLNFFMPISWLPAMSTLALGWGLFLIRLRVQPLQLTRLDLSVLLVWAVLIAVARAGLTPNHYDTGLYGLQSVKWLRENPLTWGLANLHGRLGFNSLLFPVASILQAPWDAPLRPLVFSAEVVLWAIAIEITHAFLRLGQKNWELPDIFRIGLSLCALSASTASIPLGAVATDMPVFWLSVSTTTLALEFLTRPQGHAYRFFVITLLVFVAITFKLSAGGLLLIPLGLGFIAWHEKRSLRLVRQGALLGLCAFFLFVPWLIRSWGLSGCLVYPLAATCTVSAPWSVALKGVEIEMIVIKSWARLPNGHPVEVLTTWRWLTPWSNTLLFSSEVPFLLLLTLIGFFLLLRRKTPLALPLLSWVSLTLALLGGILFWFFSAPDLRFGIGSIVSVTLLVFSLGLHTLAPPFQTRIQWRFAQLFKYAFSVTSSVLIGVLALFSLSQVVKTPANFWLPASSYPAAEEHGYLAVSHLLIHIPVDSNQCWALPLPCTPYFDETLQVNYTATGSIQMFYTDHK